ncbi:hypothetical protein FRC10_011090 [Ceratobasidium sp. 414]|nr:hypothetical protein FRC10_011090 [Ceratobasidium sp. 414]
MLFAAGLVVAAAIAGTSAFGNVSATCQSAANAVLDGPAGTCLGAPDLLDVALGLANQSLVQPLDKWLTDACPKLACTSEVIDAAFTNITTGCQSELGFATNIIEGFGAFAAEWYPIAREVACLKDSNAGDAFCLTIALQAIEKYIHIALSKTALLMVILGLEALKPPIPKDIICATCTQATYALIRPKLNDTSRGIWDKFLGGDCGSNFTSGPSPPNIKQSANDSPPQGQGNGALALSSGVLGALTAVLLGVAGVAVLNL